MSLRLKIYRDVWGAWTIEGLSPAPVLHLTSLPAAIEHARKACDAAPAAIELFVDGMYLVVHQDRGWPRQLVAPETDKRCLVERGDELCRPSFLSRLSARARGSRPLGA